MPQTRIAVGDRRRSSSSVPTLGTGFPSQVSRVRIPSSASRHALHIGLLTSKCGSGWVLRDEEPSGLQSDAADAGTDAGFLSRCSSPRVSRHPFVRQRAQTASKCHRTRRAAASNPSTGGDRHPPRAGTNSTIAGARTGVVGGRRGFGASRDRRRHRRKVRSEPCSRRSGRAAQVSAERCSVVMTLLCQGTPLRLPATFSSTSRPRSIRRRSVRLLERCHSSTALSR